MDHVSAIKCAGRLSTRAVDVQQNSGHVRVGDGLLKPTQHTVITRHAGERAHTTEFMNQTAGDGQYRYTVNHLIETRLPLAVRHKGRGDLRHIRGIKTFLTLGDPQVINAPFPTQSAKKTRA